MTDIYLGVLTHFKGIFTYCYFMAFTNLVPLPYFAPSHNLCFKTKCNKPMLTAIP
jgi:hypothetical protein